MDINKFNIFLIKESVVDAENGIMDVLEHGKMTADEVFKLIKKEYRLKKYEFKVAWDGLVDDGELVQVGIKNGEDIYKRT
jgi:tRNA splicing endonuclease